MIDLEAASSTRYMGRAFILAPLASGLLGSLVIGAAFTGGASTWPIDPAAFLLVAAFALPIAFAHMLFLGVPLYRALAPHWHIRWWSAAGWGAFVGATPFALVFGGFAIATAENADDIREIARLVGYAGSYGAVAGLVFYAVLALGERAKRKGGPLPDRPFVLPEPEA